MSPLLSFLSEGISPELVWGLVPRILGALFVLAHLSLAPQVMGLVGSRGISPARQQLAAVRRHFPGVRKFFDLPTLLWFSQSDALIRGLPWIGASAGACAIYGGPITPYALFVAWACYLSLDLCALMFPWDCLLLEAGFLALFLPSPDALPSLTTSLLPLPTVAFLFRLLVIRLMWGFAKLKFIGTQKGDDLYLQGFLAWMPMCNKLGFVMQHAPAWMLRVSYMFMWVVEVVCPLLGFFSGAPRFVSGAGLMALMAGIWATGNWGFFNVGYGALCIVLLDTKSSIFDLTSAQVFGSPDGLLTHAALSVLAFGALVYFPLNSWCSATWILWPFDDLTYKRKWLDALLSFYRFLAPFRLVNSYGVFPPGSSPPIKTVPVFEGSHDGVHFKPYGYKFMPSTETSAPPLVAPHHPRLDHLVIYAGSGMTDANYLASLVGAGKPYGFSPFSHYSWLHRLGQRLLEGEPSVLRLLGDNPFVNKPPTFVRVSLMALTPNHLEQAAHGQYWLARRCGLAVPPAQRDPLAQTEWLPPPELLHPDIVHLRRRSPELRAIMDALRFGQSHEQAVCVASDLTRDEVETFWTKVVPEIAEQRDSLTHAQAVSERLIAAHGKREMLRFERILERYAFVLRCRLEPWLYGDKTPNITKRSNFRFHLLLHEIIADGRAAFESMLLHPELAALRAEKQTDLTSLHVAAVFRWDAIRYHAQTLRIARPMTKTAEWPMPGILEFKDVLVELTPEGEVWLPQCTRADSGLWSVSGFKEDAAPVIAELSTR